MVARTGKMDLEKDSGNHMGIEHTVEKGAMTEATETEGTVGTDTIITGMRDIKLGEIRAGTGMDKQQQEDNQGRDGANKEGCNHTIEETTDKVLTVIAGIEMTGDNQGRDMTTIENSQEKDMETIGDNQEIDMATEAEKEADKGEKDMIKDKGARVKKPTKTGGLSHLAKETWKELNSLLYNRWICPQNTV